MRHSLLIIFALVFAQTLAHAQNSSMQSAPAAPQMPAATRPAAAPSTQHSTGLDLSQYGVQIAPEPRLIVMMAALDAAGFDPTPGKPTPFRARVRADQANLDPELAARMRRFYELNKLRGSATPADQAARYVSLAYALGPAPTLEAPARSDDLFEGVLDVLDFAPLVQEFYRKSGMEARLPAYLAEYRKAGDALRRPTSDMVRAVLLYLHTQPQMETIERIPVSSPSSGKKKQSEQQVFTTRVRERRFIIVPDLLAAPGAINFRVISDDYYAVVPSGTPPATSEVRRAYLQYLIDPLVLRFNRDIALRRADLRKVIDERAKLTPEVKMPDLFSAVARSLVVAADARMNLLMRLQSLQSETSERLQSAKEAERASITKDSQDQRAVMEDEMNAQLADAYERGAVFDFYFAEQLRDQETAGFDISNFISDMIARIDPARELRRPNEYVAARERTVARRAAAKAADHTVGDDREAEQHLLLVRNLTEVNELLRAKNYEQAETRLLAMMQEFQGEPRIFFALAQAASISAEDAFDAHVRDERLGKALANYRFAVQHASVETDKALLSRAHVAMGRILAFQDHKDEALKEFDAALQLGDVAGGAYKDAIQAKQELTTPPQ